MIDNRPITLSPATISLFKECQLCFWLLIKKGIKRPNGVFPSLPSGMDKILKAHFDKFRVKEKLPPELSELSGVRLLSNTKQLEVWRNNRKGITYEDKELGIMQLGAIDDMLDNIGKLIVVDFKTRGFPLKEDTHEIYQSQLDIYTYLLEKNGFDVEKYSYLLFYYPEKIKDNGSVSFNTKLVKMKTNPKNAENLFRNAVSLLKQDKPPEKSEDCEYCRYAVERGQSN